MTAVVDMPGRDRLPSYALFAGLLASAGLPIYIHAPKFFVDSYGVSLAALGGVLFVLRLLDVVQDPFFGWLSARTRAYRGVMVAVSVAILAGAMVALFAVAPPFAPLAWFALCLTLLFSAYSFLTITFYAEGVAKAGELGDQGHLRLAAWREAGALLGVCLAAATPSVLIQVGVSAPFAVFAGLFAGIAALGWAMMRGEWGRVVSAPHGQGWRPILGDQIARRLLVIAFINAAPVAASSTLFLFFVESRLAAGEEAAGLLLLLFFLAAALATPIWTRLAARFGARPVLMCGMALSMAAFFYALFLQAGDVWIFAAICLGSGAALGADMALLPAIFARRMATIAPSAAEGFGLWAFVSKFTLAFAAVTLLPLLSASGFEAGTNNPPEALVMLSVLYAGLPCALKVIAIVLLAVTPLEED